MTLKQRIDFDQRRELILDSVSSLFAEKGLGVTTKELAVAAGVSEALIYKHFKSKEELFENVKMRCCNAVHSIAELVLEQKDLKAKLALSMTLVSYTILIGFDDDVLPKHEVHKLVLQSLSSEGDFAMEIFSNFGRWVEPISENMVVARKEGWLQKTPFTDEEALWMVHHFLIGVASSRVPKQKLKVFDVPPLDLVKKCATQAFIMIGMAAGSAEFEIEKALKEISKYKGATCD